MCLVTYLPVPSGFVLSSNRDESPLRDAIDIQQECINGENIIYPADTHGGSWIFFSDRQRIVCLLNGAFKDHVRSLPYKKSRGIMMKEFFSYSEATDFLQHYDFGNIEPFTMVIVESKKLYEYRWDGNTKHIRTLDNQAIHAWSSCTLYDDGTIKRRAMLIKDSLRQVDLTNLDDIIEAHLIKNSDDPNNGLYMNRNGLVQTISHTQIIQTDEAATFTYLNLINNTRVFRSIHSNIL